MKQITRLYDSCDQCGLPVVNCICNKGAKVCTLAKFWILSSEREFSRPSNTARLLKLINPESTEIFLWERTRRPEQLYNNLCNGKFNVFLLFPAENEELAKRRVSFKSNVKAPAFILLDGTWQEARKIFRKSDYLQDLPLVSLEADYVSRYDLRRGAGEGNLCTIEAAIEILKINEEFGSSQSIEGYFKLFLKSYKAGASGHKLSGR